VQVEIDRAATTTASSTSKPAPTSCTLSGVTHVTPERVERLFDMRVRTCLVALIVLFLAIGQAVAAGGAESTVRTGSSSYGAVLFDGHGKALYAFTRDPRGRSTCSGACAAAWPPYTIGGKVQAGVGADRTLISTTTRLDGKRQVTYAGRPLYYYVGDREPGQILCQNVVEFGGRWLVMRPNGRLVR
jgi:predicted lipoprotein with Yx(FWY)xxD motif